MFDQSRIQLRDPIEVSYLELLQRDALVHTSIFLRNFGLKMYKCVHIIIGVKIH
jgi:hypothetical protein